MKLLDKIYKEGTTTNNHNIGEYINENFGMLLNNRVGTYLKEHEIQNVRSDDNTEFKSGRMLAHLVQNNTYKFWSTVHDINIGMKLFYHNPWGPFELVEKMNLSDLTLFLDNLAEKYGKEVFRAHQWIRDNTLPKRIL